MKKELSLCIIDNDLTGLDLKGSINGGVRRTASTGDELHRHHRLQGPYTPMRYTQQMFL